MKHFVAVLFLMALVGSASGQITLTGDEFLSRFGQSSAAITDSYSSSDTTGVRALEMLSGPNVTWNFGSRQYVQSRDTNSMGHIIAYPGGAPMASDPDFTSSTHVLIVPDAQAGTTIYEYVTANNSGFWISGAVQDSAGVYTKVLAYSPAYQILKFPMSYGTTWQSSSDIKVADLPPGVTYRQGSFAVADGWGTLQVPNGNYSALRSHQTDTTTMAYPPFLNQQTRSNSFTWYTETNTSASISADSALRPYSIDYSVAVGTGGVEMTADQRSLQLRISQNPASRVETRMYYTLDGDSKVTVTLCDVSGNVLRTLENGLGHIGENQIQLDPKSLTPGTYFIHLSTPKLDATEKLLIVR